jgi:CHAT domain-containing protein
MTNHLDLLNAALGHSPIYEECRGDFSVARRLAEEWLQDARGQTDPLALADALLARSFIHYLQGEPLAALACLDEVKPLIAADPHRRLRALCYTDLAMRQRYMVYPGGSSLISLEVQARWDIAAFAQTQEQEWLALSAQVTDHATTLEALLCYRLLSNLPAARYLVANRYLLEPAAAAQKLDVALSGPLDFRQRAEDLQAPPSLLAYADRVIADLYWQGKQPDAARQRLLQAEKLYERINDAVGIATCWMTLGDWKAAPFTNPLMWNHVTEEGTWTNALAPIREQQEFRRSQPDVESARTLYQEAEHLFTTGSGGRGLGAIQLRYGYLAALAGDYPAVIAHARQAQDHFTASGDILGIQLARVHHTLGLVGAPQRREDSDTARSIGDWGRDSGNFGYCHGLGLLLARVGRSWLTQDGDYERALLCYRLAQTLFIALGAADPAAQCQVDQGNAYQMVGEHAASLAAYEQAREAYARIIETHPVLAVVAWEKALMLADEVCGLNLARQNAAAMEHSTIRLQALYRQRPTAGGIELFGTEFADNIDFVVAMRKDFAAVLAPLCRGLEAQEAGRETDAQTWFDQALAAARQTGTDHRDFLEANVRRVQRRYPEARAAFQRYLDQGGAAGGFSGHLAQRMAARFGPGGQLLADDRPAQNHEFAATFFNRLRAYPEARTQLDALDRLRGPDWWAQSVQSWEILSLYGEVHEGLGQLTAALDHYDRAIQVLESQRSRLSGDELKTALAGAVSSQYLYFYAARTALKLQTQAEQSGDAVQADDYAARAFAYAEQGRARALLDLLAGTANASGADPLFYELRRLNAQLSLWRNLLAQEYDRPAADTEQIVELRRRIDTDTQGLQEVETRLTAGSDFLQSRPFTPAEIGGRLPPDGVLLEYAFLDDNLLIWAITRQGLVQTHRAELDTQVLKQQIQTLHRACEGGAPLTGLAEPLADALLEPVAGLLRTHRRVVVVPFGMAHRLPFHVLPWQGQPLVVTHSLSYLPSASALQFLQRVETDRQQPLRLLAVGNPSRMAYQPSLGGAPIPLNPLPGAETEAMAVGALFAPDSEVLLADEASEAAVRERLASYSLLHFATHGYLSEDTPLLSAILLADGEALSVYELSGLRLHAALVVLSACNTAQGQTTRGDDVLGLSRGLLTAGAQAAVVSLWPVHDISTSLLMSEFYRRLQHGATPAAALQEAQNYLRGLEQTTIQTALAQLQESLLRSGPAGARFGASAGPAPERDYSHPYHWAPFVVIGGLTAVTTAV